MARRSQKETKLKEEYAFKLFCSNEYNRKEIAEKVGIQPSTLRRWITKGKWEDHAVSISMSKEGRIKTLMAQLKELQDHIMEREAGKRFASTQEADAQLKLAKAIEAMESEVGVSDTVNVMRPFLMFCRQEDSDLAKEIMHLSDRYIQSLLSK